MVLERLGQRTHLAVDDDLFVHLVARPARGVPVVKANLPVGPGIAVPQELAEVFGQPGNAVAVRPRKPALAQCFDLHAQRRRDDLIGID